jgi:hypothetical protein
MAASCRRRMALPAEDGAAVRVDRERTGLAGSRRAGGAAGLEEGLAFAPVGRDFVDDLATFDQEEGVEALA